MYCDSAGSSSKSSTLNGVALGVFPRQTQSAKNNLPYEDVRPAALNLPCPLEIE